MLNISVSSAQFERFWLPFKADTVELWLRQPGGNKNKKDPQIQRKNVLGHEDQQPEHC